MFKIPFGFKTYLFNNYYIILNLSISRCFLSKSLKQKRHEKKYTFHSNTVFRHSVIIK